MPPAMQPRTQQSRSVQLETINLTDNLSTTRKLSSSGAWLKLRFRLSATTQGGTPTGLNRYEGLAILDTVRLKVGGRPIFDLTPGEIFKQQMYLSSTRPERIPASTTVGAWAYSFEVNFILPKPFTYPRSGITAFPSGILPNIELEVICPPSLLDALYTAKGTTTFSGQPQLTVTAEIMDVSNTRLARLVAKNRLHGYQQLSQSDQPTATGTRDIQLVAGEGVMILLYASNANGTNLAFTDGMATDVVVICGANDFVTQSRFQELQNRGREWFGAPDPVVYTGLNTTGTMCITYTPNGALGEGIDLNGLQSLKLRQQLQTVSNNNGDTEVIQHILLQGYWRTIANIAL